MAGQNELATCKYLTHEHGVHVYWQVDVAADQSW